MISLNLDNTIIKIEKYYLKFKKLPMYKRILIMIPFVLCCPLELAIITIGFYLYHKFSRIEWDESQGVLNLQRDNVECLCGGKCHEIKGAICGFCLGACCSKSNKEVLT